MSWLDKAWDKIKSAFGNKSAGGSKEKCPLEETGLAVIVMRVDGNEPVEGAIVDIKGKTPFSKKTDDVGLALFKPVEPDNYGIKVTLPKSLADTHEEPAIEGEPVSLGAESTHVIPVLPLASIKVKVLVNRGTNKENGLGGVAIHVETTDGKTKLDQKTKSDGSVKFEKLKPGEYLVSITDLGAHKQAYEKAKRKFSLSYPPDNKEKVLPDGVPPKVPIVRGDQAEVVIELVPVLRVYLVVQFKDPDPKEKARPLPEKLPLKLIPETGAPIEALVGKDGAVSKDGNPWVDVPRAAKAFTIDFTQADEKYVVCEKAKGAKAHELVAKADVAAKITAGNRVFRLPKGGWTLRTSDWEVDSVPAYKKNKAQFADLENPGTGVGTDKQPVKLVLNPHWQYYRFEYLDPYYGHSDHGNKRISIPSVVVKGVRKSPDASSTDYDGASNWTIGSDPKALLQCLPWIISKKDENKNDAGTALPKLNPEMFLEFAEEHMYVVSKSATEREIKKLDPTGTDKDKLKPGPDRGKYYDLPKKWKSKNYYTRMSDGTAKFFDELTEGEIEAAYDSAKPLAFSLDDIVLVDNGGSQAITDADETDAAKPLSEHSRVTLVYLDSADVFKVKVHDPEAKAAYHSKYRFPTFKKTGDAKTYYRNAIVDFHLDTRAIVFCSGFHDLYDKRTEAADFGAAKREILGARAAKLHDSHISAMKSLSGWADADVNAAYVCGGAGNFDLHYLHYCGIDRSGADPLVVGALVTYWSARFFHDPADKPTGWDLTKHPVDGAGGDKTNYVESGMQNAMRRWNGKDYELEKHQGPDVKVKIKTFCLFEAKQDFQVGTDLIKRGGKHKCFSALTTDAKGSWMSDVTASLRRSGYKDEAKPFGGVANDPLNNTADHGGGKTQRLAVAHELGHAGGLDDDYVYYAKWGADSLYPAWRYEQYYPGMPYSIDALSLMNSNHALRMRHYWGRVNWLNDCSDDVGKCKGFLGGAKFKMTFSPPGADKLNFELINAKYRNIYKPAYKETGVSFGTDSKNDLFLYKLGDGETSRVITANKKYKGILAVVTFISVRFSNGTAGNWTAIEGSQWLNALRGDFENMLNKKFKLTCAGDNDFNATYVMFASHWEAQTNPATAGTRFVLKVAKDKDTADATKPSPAFATAANVITVGYGCNNKKIIRFFFGKDDTNANLVKGDLDKLSTWIGDAGRANKAFAVEDI